MNIFAVSPDPADCARVLDDRRLVKMVLETAQLLSTAARCRPDWIVTDPNSFYRLTHAHHPVSLWVRQDRTNFDWTCRLLAALLDEYSHRYEREHACSRIALALPHPVGADPLPNIWCNCTPYSDMPVFDAYRRSLAEKWFNDIRPPTWRHRQAPIWWTVPE